MLSFYNYVPQMTIMMYGFWDINQTKFFVILGYFLPFYLPNNPKKWVA